MSTNYQLRTVVIDAGHGGKDHGCSHNNKDEKHIALNIALQLGKMIKHYYPEVKLVYTRTSDVFVPLHRRAEIANTHQADLFISIHCNSIVGASGVHGSETYVMGLHRADDNLAVAKRENAAILMESNYQRHYQGFDPNSAEGHIILSMFQNAYLEQSIRFAELVEKNIHKRAKRKSRGVKQAGFLVLRETTMPSVLVETGYLTNSKDNAFLGASYGQYSMAQAIFHAFREYKIEQEGQLATAPAPQAVSDYLPYPGLTKALPVKPASVETSRGNAADFAPARARNSVRKRPLIKSTPRSKQPSFASIVQYKVQLAVSANAIDTSAGSWKKANYSIELKREKGLYKYLAIGFNSYLEAVQAKKKLRKSGFKEAFVVAYQGGKRISIEQASN